MAVSDETLTFSTLVCDPLSMTEIQTERPTFVQVFFLTRPFQNVPSTLFLSQAVLLMLLVQVKQMSAWVPVIFFPGECSRTSVEIPVPSSRAAALSGIDPALSSGSQHTRVFPSSRFLQPTFHPGQIGLTVNIMWVLLLGVIIVFIGNKVKSKTKD